jgi:hypothetical protein
MSDTTITEKITDTLSETVTNVLKKSGISDKLDRFGLYLVVPIVGVIVCGICGFQILSEQNTKNRNENMVLNSINRDLIINITKQIDNLHEKISDLEIKITEQLDKQDSTLKNISELPLLNIGKEKPISSCSSRISILMEELPGKPDIYIEENHHDNNEEKNIETNEGKNNDWIDTYDDDEVSNECYDSLPLNGVKKITGVKSFFWYAN